MKQYRHQPGTSSRIYYLLTVKDDGTMELVFHGTDRTLTEEASVNADGWIVTKGAMYPPLSNGKWQEVEHTGTVPMCESESDNTDGLSPACESSEIVAAEEATTDCTDDTDSYSEPAELETTNCTNDTNSETEQNDAPTECQQPKAKSQQPREQDLFAQMQMEMQALREENERLKQCNMIQTERTAVCSPTLPETGNATRRGQEPSADDTLSHSCSSPRVSRERRRQPSSAKRQTSQDPYSRLYGSPAIAVGHSDDHSDRNRKIIAAVATAAVFIVLVNTIGLFGIAALGLLAGGLIK